MHEAVGDRRGLVLAGELRQLGLRMLRLLGAGHDERRPLVGTAFAKREAAHAAVARLADQIDELMSGFLPVLHGVLPRTPGKARILVKSRPLRALTDINATEGARAIGRRPTFLTAS